MNDTFWYRESLRGRPFKVALADAKLRRAAIVEAATAQGATDADTVVALLAEDESIEVDEAGDVSGAEKAVKALIKAKSFLKGGSGSTSGAEFNGSDGKTLDQRIKEAEDKGDWALSRKLKMSRHLSGPSA